MATRFLFLILASFLTIPVSAQWVNLNANLPGTLTSVSFSNVTSGIVGGTAGLFLTSNGGTSWQRINPTGSASDTMMYHNTHFKAIQYTSTGASWVAVGQDTVQNKPVIFRINSTGTSCVLVYSGSFTLGLNDVRQVNTYLITVGKFGLALSSSDAGVTWGPLQNFSSSVDLSSLTSNGATVFIVGSGITYRTTNFPNNSWTTYTLSPPMNKIAYSGGIFGVATTMHYSTNSGLTYSALYNYNNGPLDGRSVFFRTSPDGSIATDHGVYRSVGGVYTWEYQPSSAGYDLHDLFFISSTGYAVGANGTVLKTTNSGDPSLPYVNYTSQNGACVDSTIAFTNISPTSGYTYRWKNTGVQFATTYSSTYTFTSTGTFPIRLVGTHVSVSDSVSRNMPIVTLPDANKTISISDTLLCKSGNSDITVHNSESGIVYRLIRVSPWGEVDQVTGNGGDVILNTGTITDSTNYRIKATSGIADCGAYLPQLILIGVEKTKAKYHSTLINADINENVQFLNISEQAAYAAWTFTPNAIPATSTTLNPVVQFGATGNTSVTLIATSIYGCIDTVTGSGPMIFDNTDPALNIPCWAININGTNPGFTYDLEAGLDIVSDANGNLLVSGRYTDAFFTSRAGISYYADAPSGMFVAEYNSNGVLKWLIRSENNDQTTVMTDVERANDGSIYATGYGSGITLFSNGGDSVNIGSGGYVFHFDSLGALLWYAGFTSVQQERLCMKTDTAGNVYLAFNGSPTSFVSSVSGPQTIGTIGARFVVVKINANGTFGWLARATNGSAYYTGVNDLAISDGYIYITGNYSQALTFAGATSGSVGLPAAGQGCDIFVAKYSHSGQAIWAQHIATAGTAYMFDYGMCVDADRAGNIYLSGEVNSYYTPDYVEFPGPGASIVQVQIGQLFYAALDSSGIFRWAGGTKYVTNGRSQVVTLGKNQNVLGSGWMTNSTSADFISSDNTYTTMPVNQGSFYFTSYDTAGVLNFVNSETGLTPIGQGPVTDAWGIDDDTAGNMYVTGGVRGFNNNQYYPIADTTLALNYQDAFIAKIGSTCIDTNTFVNIITGSAENSQQNKLLVYPNPSAGDFTVASDTPIDRIQISNMLGQVLTDVQVNTNKTILHIEHPGVYMITTYIRSEQFTQRLIVQ